MAFEDVRTLAEELKWYDAAEKIIEIINDKEYDTSNNQELVGIFYELVARLHPATMTKLSIAIAVKIGVGEGADIIQECMENIKNGNRAEERYSSEMLRLELVSILCKVMNGSSENIDFALINIRKTLAWNRTKEGITNSAYLNYISYVHSIKSGDIDGAQKALSDYLFTANAPEIAIADRKELLIENLIKLSLLSSKFYDFSSISRMAMYEKNGNTELKKLYEDFAEGNIEKLNGHEAAIRQIIGEYVADETRAQLRFGKLVDKVCLINILGVCYAAAGKMVPIEDFAERLPHLERSCLLGLLFKLMGLGLVDGWIDTTKGHLYLDRIIPKNPTADDINAMKNKFKDWRRRVNEVIAHMDENLGALYE
ncbi:hypothetical protein ENBRE01_0532 [Enteropsectra breve]|nr:hypothetical protein ENBRE01_0532 [Enteropsectra breve]